MSLADKCIVVGCFVCGDYDKILMETGKFSDNIRVTENGLVSGVDRVLKSSNSTNNPRMIFGCMTRLKTRSNPLRNSTEIENPIIVTFYDTHWKTGNIFF